MIIQYIAYHQWSVLPAGKCPSQTHSSQLSKTLVFVLLLHAHSGTTSRVISTTVLHNFLAAWCTWRIISLPSSLRVQQNVPGDHQAAYAVERTTVGVQKSTPQMICSHWYPVVRPRPLNVSATSESETAPVLLLFADSSIWQPPVIEDSQPYGHWGQGSSLKIESIDYVGD